MPNKPLIELKGTTSFTRNGSTELIHKTRIEIHPDQVSVQVDGCGPDCTCSPPVSSGHPEVVQFVRDIDEALRVTAYRNRQVTPRWKPARKRRGRRHDA